MSEETPPPSPQTHSHTEEKARLECEKLRAEIKSIGKPLFRTPGFYSAFAPVALAILGLVFTWSTGWFDVQRTRVSNEKTLLEAQTERLKTQQSALETQAKEQQSRVARVEDEIAKLKERERMLTNQVATLNRERDELVSAKALLENETKRLAGSEERATQFLEQLRLLQATRESLSTNLLTLQSSNVMLRATSERQVALIRWANEVLSQGWATALSDKATWSKFRQFGDEVRMVRFASCVYLPEWRSTSEARAMLDERVRNYEDDSLTESLRLLERVRSKDYDAYIREARERFDLLQYGIRYATNFTSRPTP